MKKTPSIRRRCEKCKLILRRRKVGGPQRRIDCETPRHKQVQG